jgi:hypothetical protein
MTVVYRRRFPDSVCESFDFMGRRCHVEVSGVQQGSGLAFFQFAFGVSDVCFAWRRSDSGIELFETDESRQYSLFFDDWQRAFWGSSGIKRLLAVQVRRVVQAG